MTRWLSLLPLGLGACVGTAGDPEACDLAAEHEACPECSSGPMTCTFAGISVTANSCGDCQARSGLYSEICDARLEATREEIEAQTVCEPTVCEVWYDGCTDACQPTCVDASTIPMFTCDVGCPTPTPPPGDCTWVGSQCDWVIATP